MLQDEYGTLEALNRGWTTEFKTWEEIRPPTRDQMKKDPKWDAAWCDHRRCMETETAEYLDAVNRESLKTPSRTAWGLSGTQAAHSYSGMDWWKIMQSSGFISVYPGAQEHYARWFRRPDGLVSMWYGYDRANRAEGNMRLIPWRVLFHGYNTICYYGTDYAPGVWGDGSPRRTGRWTKESMDDIQRGIAHLVAAAEVNTQGLAVHYSQSSIHADTLNGHRGKNLPRGDWYRGYDAYQANIYKMIEDSGLDARAIAYADVEQDALAKTATRVFLMPYAAAVSPAEAEAVRRFVREGGTVIADVIPATRDQHCRLLDKPALNDVFGVETGPADCLMTGAALTLTNEPLRQAAQNLQVTRGIVACKPAGAMALASFPGPDNAPVPAVMVNTFGKGTAIYLNFLIDANTWKLVNALLADRGIKPPVRFTSPKRAVTPSFFDFHLGKARYIGVLSRYIDTLHKEGGFTNPATFEFDRAAVVYESRQGKAFGETQTVTLDFTDGDANFFALLPKPVTALRAAAPRTAERGRSLKVDLARECASPDLAFAQVKVFGPDGVEIPLLRRIVRIEENKGRTEVPLAFNDPAGTWRIEARDAASGMKGEARVEVR
jgi:hypothetical protein